MPVCVSAAAARAVGVSECICLLLLLLLLLLLGVCVLQVAISYLCARRVLCSTFFRASIAQQRLAPLGLTH